MLDQWKICCF